MNKDEETSARVPEFESEGHICDACGVDYGSLGVEEAILAIAAHSLAVRVAVENIPGRYLSLRPDPATWSVVEYVCHLRDVYATSTIRLYRIRTEVDPILEPMLNDLRAARFAYRNRNILAVVDEIDDNAAGLRQEAERVSTSGWDRRASRRVDENRTARWFVRHAMHEGRHHLGDIAAVASRLGWRPERDGLS